MLKMTIDWDSLTSDNATKMAGSICLMPPTDVLYSFTALFTKLIDYNDTKDSSDMTSYGPDTTGWSVYDFSELTRLAGGCMISASLSSRISPWSHPQKTT